jgi:lipopolysaccharide export system protein LptA
MKITPCPPFVDLRAALAARALSTVIGLGICICICITQPARAEKADRSKPLVVEADRPGTIDVQRNVVVFNGNVAVSQGTMVLRAERIEMREMADGYRAATALGSAGKPATWRQKRDGGDETVEGTAERIELDSRADTLRLAGNSAVRRSRGGTVAEEITGGVIVWDNRSEIFKVEGGATSPSNPSGRVRVVLTPRAETGAAAAPASAAGSAPVGQPLAPSRMLEERRP